MKIFTKLSIAILFILVVICSIYASGHGHGFKDKILDGIEKFASNIYLQYLAILIIAMMPIFELRGSIPYGFLMMAKNEKLNSMVNLNPILIVVISIIGNMIPIFFILFLFGPVEKFFRRFKIFNKLFDWIFKRTRAKSKAVERFQEIALMSFVAIPFPITGAWTGSLVSYLFKLSYLKSIIFIFFGVLIAAGIVTPITLYFKNFDSMPTHLKILLGGLIGVLVISYIIFNIIKKAKEKKDEQQLV